MKNEKTTNQKSVKKFPRTVKMTERRVKALARLEAQLKSGKKAEKKTGNLIEMDKKDISRTKSEIETLKARV